MRAENGKEMLQNLKARQAQGPNIILNAYGNTGQGYIYMSY